MLFHAMKPEFVRLRLGARGLWTWEMFDFNPQQQEQSTSDHQVDFELIEGLCSYAVGVVLAVMPVLTSNTAKTELPGQITNNPQLARWLENNEATQVQV